MKRTLNQYCSCITKGGRINRKKDVAFGDLLAQKPILLPGERYPERVRTVELPNGRCEPCCGTHLARVEDVHAFTVVNVKYVVH